MKRKIGTECPICGHLNRFEIQECKITEGGIDDDNIKKNVCCHFLHNEIYRRGDVVICNTVFIVETNDEE